MVNANTVFSQSQLKDLNDLISVNAELKILESKKKTLSDRVKSHMSSLNVDECELNGNSFKITESLRRTVTKTTKDEFIASLVGQGKQHLIITSIEPDVDSIFAEVDAGTLSADFVNRYIKCTSVKTLRTN